MKNIDRTKLIPVLLFVQIVTIFFIIIPQKNPALTPATAIPEPLIQDAKLECETLYSLDMLNENLGYTDSNDPQIITSLYPDLEINAAGVLAARTVDGRILRIINDQEGLDILEIPFIEMMKKRAQIYHNGLWHIEDINDKYILTQYAQAGTSLEPAFRILNLNGIFETDFYIPTDMYGFVINLGSSYHLFGGAEFINQKDKGILVETSNGYFELKPFDYSSQGKIDFSYRNESVDRFIFKLGWDEKGYIFRPKSSITSISPMPFDLPTYTVLNQIPTDILSDDLWGPFIDGNGNIYYRYPENNFLVYNPFNNQYIEVISPLSLEVLMIQTMDQYGNFYGLTRATEDDDFTEIVKCLVVE